ncbi:MAG TPA: DNA polymerase III subunit [Thermomicrobiales bacterium]|nr:DNA polymerase III subunit [Thermomicrobiales bacterium]
MERSQSRENWGVWGHGRTVRDLQRAAASSPRHSYIISGPASAGKKTIALAFAKALSCASPPAPGLFCGECSACRRIDRGTFPDVTFVDLEMQSSREKSTSRNTSLNIATVREISANVMLRPLESRWRIAIVDDVETMQETAQEAFLKTLEEPPAYTILLLLTSDADLLLPTIRSRCLTLSLQAVPVKAIADGLESIGTASDEAGVIAEASAGLPGWAIRAAADPALLESQVAAAGEAHAWARSGEYERLVTATRIADQFLKDREAVFSRLLTVQRAWRGLLHDAVNGDASVSAESSVTALKSIETCLLDLESNVRPRLALQQMVLQWPVIR